MLRSFVLIENDGEDLAKTKMEGVVADTLSRKD